MLATNFVARATGPTLPSPPFPGIISFMPTRIMSALPRPLVETSASIETPYRRAICDSVSPACTVWMVGVGRGATVGSGVGAEVAAAEGVEPAEATLPAAGITSFCPTQIRSALLMPLACRIADAEMPNLRAMPARVSPNWTV